MASYTDITSAQVEQIVAVYPVRLRGVSPLLGGAANSSYLLDTDTGRYVLTILDNHDQASAALLAAVLEHLVANDIPTSRPLRTQDGVPLSRFAGRPVMIKEYVPGTCDHPLAASLLATAGRLLAQVHSVPAPAWLPRDNRRLPADWVSATERFEDRRFAEWLHEQYEVAAPALCLEGPAGLVHGDLFPDNLVVQEGGGLTVLDWETAGRDLFVLDLGMAIVGLCRQDCGFLPEHARALIDGYQAHRPLGDAERRVLYQAVIYASLIIGYHRYRRHHLSHPDPTKQHLYREIPAFVSSLSVHWPQTERRISERGGGR